MENVASETAGGVNGYTGLQVYVCHFPDSDFPILVRRCDGMASRDNNLSRPIWCYYGTPQRPGKWAHLLAKGQQGEEK